MFFATALANEVLRMVFCKCGSAILAFRFGFCNCGLANVVCVRLFEWFGNCFSSCELPKKPPHVFNPRSPDRSMSPRSSNRCRRPRSPIKSTAQEGLKDARPKKSWQMLATKKSVLQKPERRSANRCKSQQVLIEQRKIFGMQNLYRIVVLPDINTIKNILKIAMITDLKPIKPVHIAMFAICFRRMEVIFFFFFFLRCSCIHQRQSRGPRRSWTVTPSGLNFCLLAVGPYFWICLGGEILKIYVFEQSKKY